MSERILAWEGLKNARDLGGLPTMDGRTTRWTGVVRSDTPARLTPTGWSALYNYGIRTIISLHTHGMEERELDIRPPYPDITALRVPIEDVTDTDFLQQWVNPGLWCTPLYYQDALRRWPERHAAAISAIARARPGGVLFHCVGGKDRTGIVAILLLALAGVTSDGIIADYELSPDPERDALLARQGSSVPQAIRGTLAGLQVDQYLVMGGTSPDDLAAARRRLLG